MTLKAVPILLAVVASAHAFQGSWNPMTLESDLMTNNLEGFRFRETFARRADGSFVHVTTSGFPPGKTPNPMVMDVPGKRYFTKDDLTQLYKVIPISSAEAERLSKAPTKCEESMSFLKNSVCTGAGEDILGYKTVKIERNRSSDRGASHAIDWVAPALNYMPLKAQRYMDGRLGMTQMIVSVTIGEPAANLFELPANYRVVLEGDFEYEAYRARGLEGMTDAMRDAKNKINQDVLDRMKASLK